MVKKRSLERGFGIEEKRFRLEPRCILILRELVEEKEPVKEIGNGWPMRMDEP